MQVLTKKPLIDLCFTGPIAKKNEAINLLKTLGFVYTYDSTSDSIPWRECFPEFLHQPEYSVVLRGARKREGLTQKQLSEMTGIPQGHISAMEHGKMSIGKERAKKLAKVLNTGYKVFL